MTDLFEGSSDHEDTEVKLEDLVGDGKKFKSVEDLAKGKLESDRFIAQLQSELKGIREELNTRITLTEFMDNFKNSNTQPNQPSGDNQDRTGGESTALKPDDLRKLLDEELAKREQVSTARQNLNTVKQKLSEAFGPNYATRLEEEARKLNVSKEFLNNMAATTPSAFFRLVGVEASAPRDNGDVFSPPPSQRTATPLGNGTSKNKSYFDKIKAADPKVYWSPAVQNEMHREALRQGEAFFN